MQQENYLAAEAVYRKAQIIDPDANKACNLCQCLIKQACYLEAQSILDEVIQNKLPGSSDPKSKNRVKELLQEFESRRSISLASTAKGLNLEDAFLEGLDQLMSQWTPYRSRRLPIFEEISSFRDQLACWFYDCLYSTSILFTSFEVINSLWMASNTKDNNLFQECVTIST